MGRTKRFVITNACYHLIVRGNQKQKVFNTDKDYFVYLKLLRKFKKKFKFRVYAYCLMPNHVHILGETQCALFLSKFMHDLNRAYACYFNNTYRKVGHLWQGRFKSKPILKDEYLIDCFNYIELNPIRANLAKRVHEYRWTSYGSRVLEENDFIVDEYSSR